MPNDEGVNMEGQYGRLCVAIKSSGDSLITAVVWRVIRVVAVMTGVCIIPGILRYWTEKCASV